MLMQLKHLDEGTPEEPPTKDVEVDGRVTPDKKTQRTFERSAIVQHDMNVDLDKM